mgnify:CR=1 FL=1
MGTPVYLVLENGEYWQGESFGAADQDVTGEVVFTTGMTGYLETLTPAIADRWWCKPSR